MNFGSYDCRKNVNSVIVTLGAYETEDTELWYLTDYEERKDLTNLRVVGIPQSASLTAPFTKRGPKGLPPPFGKGRCRAERGGGIGIKRAAGTP